MLRRPACWWCCAIPTIRGRGVGFYLARTLNSTTIGILTGATGWTGGVGHGGTGGKRIDRVYCAETLVEQLSVYRPISRIFGRSRNEAARPYDTYSDGQPWAFGQKIMRFQVPTVKHHTSVLEHYASL